MSFNDTKSMLGSYSHTLFSIFYSSAVSFFLPEVCQCCDCKHMFLKTNNLLTLFHWCNMVLLHWNLSTANYLILLILSLHSWKKNIHCEKSAASVANLHAIFPCSIWLLEEKLLMVLCFTWSFWCVRDFSGIHT